jgi:ribosomal protein S18 acetylase RimI-like enzyme
MIKDRELEIRPVQESEIEQVLEVYRKCEDFLSLGPVPKASKAMVQKDLEISKEENGVFCGIYAGGNRMIGIVDFIPKGYDQKPDRAYLALLMIAKSYRYQGIGARVVRLIEIEIMKDPDIQYIYSGVQVNNAPAIKFWSKMGYQIYAGPELMPDQTTVYHLKKKVFQS